MKRYEWTSVRRSALCGLTLLLCSQTEVWALDCTRVREAVERWICADARLLQYDAALNQNYRAMLSSNIDAGMRGYLRETQRAWLHQRNACTTPDCVLSRYRERLVTVCEMPVISGVHPVCEDPQSVESQFASERMAPAGVTPLVPLDPQLGKQ